MTAIEFIATPCPPDDESLPFGINTTGLARIPDNPPANRGAPPAPPPAPVVMATARFAESAELCGVVTLNAYIGMRAMLCADTEVAIVAPAGRRRDRLVLAPPKTDKLVLAPPRTDRLVLAPPRLTRPEGMTISGLELAVPGVGSWMGWPRSLSAEIACHAIKLFFYVLQLEFI